MATALKTYSITCTCGDKVLQVEASDKDEAFLRIQESLDELALANHAAEKHPLGDGPTMEEMGELIAVTLAEE